MDDQQAAEVDEENEEDVEEEEEEDQDEESEEEEGEDGEDLPEELPELRSLNSIVTCYVQFKSLTKRGVDVFWIDFKGKRCKYTTLSPGEEYLIQTFETHPWLFRDAETGVMLHGNAEEVFMPESIEGDEANDGEFQEEWDRRFMTTVCISIPVYPLLHRCVEVCAQVYNNSRVDELDLPVCLKMDLLTHQLNRNVPFSVYEEF